MHSSQLAELGSWVATNSEILVYGEQEQPMLVATTYWKASKVRLQRWIASLKMFENDFDHPREDHNPWPALEIVVQEILMSELLTRVWCATVMTHDWHHQQDEMHGLAHSVQISHIEAKNRAIRIMLRGQAADEQAFDRMNALRRRIERWTDMFLGQLPNADIASKFGFDRNRVKDFGREQAESAGAENQTRQKVLVASFSVDLMRNQIPYSANPDLNREVAAGVLGCFPSDRFDSNGLPKSSRMVWLEKSQNDTQLLIDQLAEFETQAENGNSGMVRIKR
ncbi:MAG: hypothetical protein ACI87E_000212 [Mariniblastus sp.]|jgi:hypothetical protein